ncbi:MAG: hypothetical protein AMJ43_10940 [Coxiella sp. DG_40]|nr:MAG: hypothetical protein AMJ43_10940 [Coxiella sp. DG_40]
MEEQKISISFRKKSKVSLADNEKVSLWDDLSGGSIRSEKGLLFLTGAWRVSSIGNFLGSGALGTLLIRPLFIKPRAEEIPWEDIERLIVAQTKFGKKKSLPRISKT